MTNKNADELLGMITGAITLQATLWRFLIKEGVVDRARLGACLSERENAWRETAPDYALLPLAVLVAGISADEEPGLTLH